MNEIEEYLNILFPNPKCELVYNKDYEFLIAVMLSAQTTDKRVNKVTPVLFTKYQNLKDLANANIDDIIPIVKELGNFNKKSKAIIEIAKELDNKYQGKVPTKRRYLENLPMVGRKTANVVLSTLYDIPNIAVDTHVSRVSKRLNIAKNNDDVLKIENKLKKLFLKENWNRIHYQLVLFGRYYCKAKNPLCDDCKLKNICDYYKKNNS